MVTNGDPIYSPQVLVLQEAAGADNEKDWLEAPPAGFEANRDIFFLTLSLWHSGHVTPSIALALRTSSSNNLPHTLHSNSNIGILTSEHCSVKRLELI